MIDNAIVSPCERFQQAASAWLRSGEIARTAHMLSPLEELAGFNYGFVYLMQIDARAVKIGFSEHPQRRLRELQPAYGEGLRLRACFVGEPQAERDAHKRFAHLRIENERFLTSPAIEAYFRERRESLRGRLRDMHVCAPACAPVVNNLDLRMLYEWLKRSRQWSNDAARSTDS
jgi:hypothetical protein